MMSSGVKIRSGGPRSAIPAELSHLEEALGAAEMGPLPQEALDELNTVYAAAFGGM